MAQAMPVEAIALRLDRMGFHVFAGVRREEDGEALRAAASNGLEPLYIDVTKQDSIDEADAGRSSRSLGSP